LVFDIESKTIKSKVLIEAHIHEIVGRHLDIASKEYGVDTSRTSWRLLEGTNPSKMSYHLICTDYFDSWELQCAYVKTYFSDMFKSESSSNVVDGDIYNTPGGRYMRLVNCSKKKCPEYPLVTMIDDFNLEDYFATNIMPSCQRIPFDSTRVTKIKNAWNKRDKKLIAPTVPQVKAIQEIIAENIELFSPHVVDYTSWVSIGFRLASSGLEAEDFHRISALSKHKYSESECQKKWENLERSVAEKPKDLKRILNFLTFNLGIEVQLKYADNDGETDFNMFIMFNEEIIDYNFLIPVVRKEYHGYVMETLNRFFGICDCK
jgi:hypothetical protein